MAQALAAIGHHQQAEAIAAQAETTAAQVSYSVTGWDDHQVIILSRVAEALAAAGLYQHAEPIAAQVEATARTINVPNWQAGALAAAARALAAVGHRQEAEALAAQAEATARTATEPFTRAIAFAQVAQALAAVGHYQEAEAAARAITQPDWQANALTDVAQAQQRSAATSTRKPSPRRLKPPPAR